MALDDMATAAALASLGMIYSLTTGYRFIQLNPQLYADKIDKLTKYKACPLSWPIDQSTKHRVDADVS
jgi:hypothetical protein